MPHIMEEEAASGRVEFIEYTVISDPHPVLRPASQAVMGIGVEAGTQVVDLPLHHLPDRRG